MRIAAGGASVLDRASVPVHIAGVNPDASPAASPAPAPAGAWFRTAVIYQVLIDRFQCASPARQAAARLREHEPVFCGGDLRGVAEKMPYLQELGVTALWVSPFTRNTADPTAYHGYHTTDLYQVDARFGGEPGLAALVRAAKAAGIKVILDFVANHVHRDHPFFQAALADPHSEYRDWFCWDTAGRHLSFLHFRELPKLNLEHPPARQHVIEAAWHWLQQGIDGLRCDHALGPSLAFWAEFRRVLRARAPEAALLGEVAFLGIRRDHLPTLLLPNKAAHFRAQQEKRAVLDATMKEYVDVFDGLLDFQFQHLLKRHVARRQGRVDLGMVQRLLDEHYAAFPKTCSLLSFLDNHDQQRFLFEARGRREQLLAAARLQFQQPQPPVIYYGTEIGMSQPGPFAGDFSDLKCRRMMRWEDMDAAVLAEYKALIAEWKWRFGRPDAKKCSVT